MPDDKRGREEQARRADRRQRDRDVAAELERGDEPEPPVEAATLEGLEAALEDLEFPATAHEVVAVAGDREVEATTGSYTVGELLPDVDGERFEDSRAVRMRVRRPTVAAAMKRIVEASESLGNVDLDRSRYEAYERTLRELRAIDADDEDEGVEVVTDWVVERIREEGELPGSRAVRRRAATFCRANGYPVGNDEWLGV